MSEVMYFLNQIALTEHNKFGLFLLVITLLPIVLGLFSRQFFLKRRGNLQFLKTAVAWYIVITIFMPLMLYVASSLVSGVFLFWKILGHVFASSLGLALVTSSYQRCKFNTDQEYYYTQYPEVDNSSYPAKIYPHRFMALVLAWIFILSGILFLAYWVHVIQGHSWLDMNSPLLWLIMVAGCYMVLFLLFIRLFPCCPYCKFGLFDMDFRYQPEDQLAKQQYYRRLYSTLWNVLRLKPFKCRYCQAPFVFFEKDCKD